MPTAADHYRFALTAPLDGFDRGAVLLGTQGADPFYFCGSLLPRPAAMKRRAKDFADFMHEADPERVFMPLADRVRQMPPSARSAGSSFLYGLLLHYLLDRSLHPYVYYRTGFDSDGRATGRFGVDHARFENAVAERGAAGSPVRTDPRTMFTAAEPELAAADALLSGAFPQRLEPGDFIESWRDMSRTLGLFWAPSGAKRLFLRSLSLFVPLVSAMARPPFELGETDPVDCLNESRAEWLYPATGAASRESVADLRGNALREAGEAAEAVRSLCPERSPDWSGLLRGISHEGYAPGQSMRSFRSAYR